METATLNDLHEFADLWVHVGCARKSIAPVLSAITRQNQLADEYEAALADTATPRGLAAALAAGDVRVVEAIRAAADRNFLEADTARGIVKQAQVELHRTAMAFVTANADKLATEADAVSPGPRGWLERFAGVTAPAEEIQRPPTDEEIAASGYQMDPLPTIRH